MKRRLQVVLSVLQGLVVLALGALEFLSYKKAGVSHHLRFKRTYYLHHLLTPGVRLILGAVMAVFVLYVVYSVTKKGRKTSISIGIWSFILMFFISLARGSRINGLSLYDIRWFCKPRAQCVVTFSATVKAALRSRFCIDDRKNRKKPQVSDVVNRSSGLLII